MRYTNHNLKGASARLVDILVTTSMMQWAVDIFVEMKSAVAMGQMSIDDQLDYFRDSITQGDTLKNYGIKEEAVDWAALFEFCDSFFSVKPEHLEADIKRKEYNNQQMLQGFTPKPLLEVISAEEYKKYYDELRNYEYSKQFRSYKIDELLAFIDWFDRNRGPLPIEPLELSSTIKAFARVKSGEYLANLWTRTLPFRYPLGIPWRQES